MWGEKRWHSLDYEMKKRYGQKVYRLALDGGFTCPNRDGTLGTGGCIFCSAGGSGDFAGSRLLSVSEQIEQQKALVAAKQSGHLFIAYFQAYTGTYAPVSRLRTVYGEAIRRPDVAVLSVATRPDCLPPDVLGLLAEMNRIKPVWVELGLQTIHPETADYIRRGYPLPVFEQAVADLQRLGIETIAHVILGLPGESPEDMLATAKYLSSLPVSGVKFQMLHVLRGTDLYEEYLNRPFHVLTQDEYTDILIRCLEVLRPDIVVHRLTGDGPRRLLAAPEWTLHKKQVLNTINRSLRLRDTWQGRLCGD